MAQPLNRTDLLKRIVGIALAMLAALFTAMMWSGLSVKDLLNALRF
jgi:hypothetical protein